VSVEPERGPGRGKVAIVTASVNWPVATG
jgi:hypothetical protein